MEVDHYQIDACRSKFTIRAFAAGLFSSFGHNPTLAVRDFTGEARFNARTLEAEGLQIRINARSLAVQNEMNDRDRREIERTMNQEVLETERFPDIMFESSNVAASKAGDGQYWVNLVGRLSLHGVTNTQPVAAHVAVKDGTLRANGEFSLVQTTYGIRLVSVAGGTLKLKDELKCSFDIVAHKQPDGGA